MYLCIYLFLKYIHMLLRLNNITKKYGSQVVLDKVSASFESGRVVALLGPNGAGKSTLMKIVTGYISADEGSAVVDGLTVYPNEMATKRLIGYLPEHNPLYLDMYVVEYLLFVAKIYGLGAESRRIVADVIERVGLTPEVKKRIGQLSKGYRQRVGLAAAIMHNPKVLILDEPTTGLDPNQLVEIRQLIRTLGEDRLVLFSTHIMQEVELMCNDVVVLSHGRMMLADTKENLMREYGSMDNMFRQNTRY